MRKSNDPMVLSTQKLVGDTTRPARSDKTHWVTVRAPNIACPVNPRTNTNFSEAIRAITE
ncbi:hypothetical protein D3C83_161310 [compost metagenome]